MYEGGYVAEMDNKKQADSYLAHICGDRTQTVSDHLRGTSELSARFAEAFGAGEQGAFVGLAHDIGKCSDEFQKRLHGGQIVDHSTAGAFECAKQNAFWAAACVAGHHGGLPDVGNITVDAPGDNTLCGRLKGAVRGAIPAYELPLPLPDSVAPNGCDESRLTASFVIRMLYSCLVDADYLDTERFMSNGKVERGVGDPLPVLLDKLERYIDPWWNPADALNKCRCDVLRACLDGGAQEKGLYTLTVPTGGGKTVASVAFALRHAVRHGMNRVIYVIPYTSIIEQTADVFRSIFGKEAVVEHHSDASFEVVEGGDASQYRFAKATENWDAPIVVTTSVQFFESLYANRPAKCRKLHNIANSVIIFDEAQMIPVEHLKPCVAAIAELVSHFRSTAVLCTATQPFLNDLVQQYAPGMSIKELCPDTAVLFEQLRRVTFENIGALSADALANRLSAHSRVLCIVNSRKAAQEVFVKLPKEGSYHLSTLMCPAHRRAVLAEIRQRLLDELPCRVVSTSLIEAGVDINFPAVYREMAGLDSILQAAGRCNRDGRKSAEESIVTVFEGVSATPRLLKTNIGAAKEVLRSDVDPAALETINRYFRSLRSFLSGTELDRAGVITAFENGICGCSLPFRTVSERFHMIEDASKTVFIPIGDGVELVQQLRDGKHSRALFRNLGQYGVSVYEKQFDALLAAGSLDVLDDGSAVLTNTGLYHSDFGLDIFEAETGKGYFC